MNNYFIFLTGVILMTLSTVRCAPTTETISTGLATEAVTGLITEQPLITNYEYVKNETGYMYTLILGTVVRIEELDIKDKRTPEEETVVIGRYSFDGADGYIHIINYMIDKSGNHIELDRVQKTLITPTTLKSLVG